MGEVAIVASPHEEHYIRLLFAVSSENIRFLFAYRNETNTAMRADRWGGARWELARTTAPAAAGPDRYT
jgi:hypothetical protein